MKTINVYLACFILMSVSFASTANADKMSFGWDNDAFALTGKDYGYTNGLRFGWLSDELSHDDINGSDMLYGSVMRNVVETIPFLNLDKQKKHNAGISIFQMIFTPEDITKSYPQYNDMPYAGYLMASFFLFEWDKDDYNEYSLDIGIVGPASGGAEVQKFAHKVGPFKDPKGWDKQLGNQPMIGIAYGHGDKSWTGSFDNGLDADWVNAVRFQLGTFYTGMSGSTTWRFGDNYPQNFGTYMPGIMGDSALLGTPRQNKSLGWSLSATVFTEYIAYLYTMDSDEADRYDTERNRFIGSAIGAASLYVNDFEFSFSMRASTPLLKHSDDVMALGTIAVLWHF